MNKLQRPCRGNVYQGFLEVIGRTTTNDLEQQSAFVFGIWVAQVKVMKNLHFMKPEDGSFF